MKHLEAAGTKLDSDDIDLTLCNACLLVTVSHGVVLLYMHGCRWFPVVGLGDLDAVVPT